MENKTHGDKIFVGAVLATFYIVAGTFYNANHLEMRLLEWLITWSAPIGFTLLGYVTKIVEPYKDNTLAWGVGGIVAYTFSVVMMNMIPNELTLNMIEAIFFLVGFFCAGIIGGLNLGQYWRLCADE